MSNNYTRIRYIKTSKSGVVRSTRKFHIGVSQYEVVLDFNTMQFILREINTEEKVKGGKTKNIAVLKKQAKRGLEKLGYIFEDENRNVIRNVQVEQTV